MGRECSTIRANPPRLCSVMFSMSFIPLQDLCHLGKHLFVFSIDIKEGCTFAIDAKAEP